MKRYFLIFFILLFSLFSCEREPLFEEVEYDKFNHQLFEMGVTMEELVKQSASDFGTTPGKLLLEVGYSEQEAQQLLKKLNFVVALAKDYTVHGIAYNTKDPFGESVVASGLLYCPQNRLPKGLIFVYPFFKTKGQSGTDDRFSVEALLALAGDYICLVPDGIGLGTSANQPLSIIQHDNIAEICVDFYLAAREFVYNHYHYKIPNRITVVGYSSGASGAWALARYISLHKEFNIKAKDIFVGGGVFHPDLCINDLFETRYSLYAASPYIIWSLNYYENLNLDFTKIFKGKLLEGFPEFCDGSLPVREVTPILGHDLNDYFNEDFLQNEDNRYRLIIMDALKKHSIPNDWIPDCTVHLYNCYNDLYVPPISGNKLYEYLMEINADVKYVHEDITHEQMMVRLLMDFYKHLYPNLPIFQ
ncbi:MAG: hypothetical protein GX993_05590 [Bacteroidales bacterium]|nr:hypothetical protein [Bacteroidales bacterium]